MTSERIFSAGFADNRHRRPELLFALFLTPKAQQERPFPGAKPSCCWRQPMSRAGHPHRTQLPTAALAAAACEAEVVVPQTLPFPLITQLLTWPCQGCSDKERICNPVLLPQGFIFRRQIQQSRDCAVGRDNSVSNARC